VSGDKPRVVIVGGGFGGIHAAHALLRAPVDVTVIDRTNHSVFYPLLYQVATCGLSADEISAPIRFLLRGQRNAEVLMAEVTGFDLQRRMVIMGARELSYDFLIVAVGTRYNYFGHHDWPRLAPSLKSVADAAYIRRKILHAFEQAELESDPETVQALLTFALVGAGPTGVELAGALAELARFTLRREYRHIDTNNTRIILLEAAPRILLNFPQRLAQKARLELERKGVQVMTGAAVTAIDSEGVTINGQARIRSLNVIWTAGIEGNPLGRALGAQTDRLGRVKVLPDLSVPGYPEVFVIGDLMVVEQNGQPFSPGLAPVAMQQGAYVGRLIGQRVAGGQAGEPFRYRDKGALATVGRAFAIADFGRLKLAGFWAWMLWWGVHVFYLASLWNRFQVLATWMWAYLTYERSVRILTPQPSDLAEHNVSPSAGRSPPSAEAGDAREQVLEQSSSSQVKERGREP
jgi:NADH dehydrogenase